METEILNAKRQLYYLLLKLNDDTMSDNELDIMLLLSRDKQIQELFDKSTK